jgi:hypothetical protein
MAGVRSLRLVPEQRVHLLPERAELLLDLCCPGKLIWPENRPHLNHGLEPLVGDLPAQVVRSLGERQQLRVIRHQLTRSQQQVAELLAIRLQLAPQGP